MKRDQRSHPTPGDGGEPSPDAMAADWLVAHDGGLTPERQREFDRWLAADISHARAWAEACRAWTHLDRLAEMKHDERFVAAPEPRRGRWLAWSAVAAVLALGGLLWFQLSPRMSVRSEPRVVTIMPEQRTLPDGSVVELNHGSEVREEFTASERRVCLVRGEARFAVTKNPARPFVVEAGGVTVRAVGTAFNVRLDRAAVEVLVTEGKVQVNAPSVSSPAIGAAPAAPEIGNKEVVETPMVEMGQRLVVGLGRNARPMEISAISPLEMARSQAWRETKLQFHDMPLSQVAAAFNHHNPAVRIMVHPSVAHVLIAGTFRADNAEVFVRLLEEGFDIRSERRADGTILLRTAQ